MPSWLPGAGFHALAKEGYAVGRELITNPWVDAMSRIAEGLSPVSFVQVALNQLSEDPYPELEEDIKEVAATMYGGKAFSLQ